MGSGDSHRLSPPRSSRVTAAMRLICAPSRFDRKSGSVGSKTDIWMPLYIGDYLADTVMLDAEQSGCYLHWLMCYWRTGPLEDDLESLILIGKLKNLPSASSTAQALLKKFFKREEDGKWHQKRIDAEMVQWRAKKQKAIEKASKGGKALKELRSASSTSQAVLNECPSPSPISKSVIKTSLIEEIYSSYPKKKDKIAAFKAIERAVKRIMPSRDGQWLLERTRRYAASREYADEQFTPYPATWFNRGGYDDPEEETHDGERAYQESDSRNGHHAGGEDRSGIFESLYQQTLTGKPL